MPLQNRVTPAGEIVASPARGTMFGNRGGCFHDAQQRLKRRPYATTQWICCVLQFKNRRRRVMSPGLYTELFFLDEVTAIAAGHRPCFECRRADATKFAELWAKRTGMSALRASAPQMDAVLHADRISSGYRKITHQADSAALPDGAFISLDGKPHLKWQREFWPWSLHGYGNATILPSPGTVEVLTPSAMVAQMAAGYRPSVHHSLPH